MFNFQCDSHHFEAASLIQALATGGSANNATSIASSRPSSPAASAATTSSCAPGTPRRIGHETSPVVVQRQLQEPIAGVCGNMTRPRNVHLVFETFFNTRDWFLLRGNLALNLLEVAFSFFRAFECEELWK